MLHVPNVAIPTLQHLKAPNPDNTPMQRQHEMFLGGNFQQDVSVNG
jgi:hypothetical protein